MPSLNILQPRRTCYYRNDGFYDCDDSNWHSWGRWVALAVIVVCSIICFMLIACINSRRRRRHGGRPIYGTGWMAPLPKYSANLPPGHQPYNQGMPQNGYYAPPPPAYGQQPNQAWGQPGAIPLQQPQPTYTGDYAPPTGPPPGK